ncbi:MAG: TetR/AcrR family transcriptional regulator [Microbacteriaceae bacterium]|nr:TetR/AcrR family transcriptional regulator [Microbacteriaceae bacterium]
MLLPGHRGRVRFEARPVRDAIVAALTDWDGYLTASVRFAVEQGELSEPTDPEQLAFKLLAPEGEANSRSMLSDSREPYDRARTATSARLRMLGADPAVLAEAGLA